MSLYQSVRTITRASGDGPVDWGAVGTAAVEATAPGSIDLSSEEQTRYLEDVTDARRAIIETAAIDFALPNTFEIQNRHHWIEANVVTFKRVMEPIAARQPATAPGPAIVINTGTMTGVMAFLARNVLGQYDPLLLADEDDPHGLYFVHPNIERVASELDVDRDRFRRWIVFHEVTHAAEFGIAPWLPDVMEEHLLDGVDALARGTIDRNAFRKLDATMTAVEGYAELLMDEAFDREAADLREKIEQRRRGGGPLMQLMRRLLGLDIKRRQYERGKEFFEAVVAARGIEAAGEVWADPENLPKWDEFDEPARWLSRVDP